MKQARRGKIIIWFVFVVLFALLYFQNREFFDYHDKLGLDLFVFEFSTSPMPVAVYYLGFLLFGYCIAFFAGLIQRFKDKKRIQILNTEIEDHKKKLASLKESAEPSEAGPEEAGETLQDQETQSEARIETEKEHEEKTEKAP